MNFSIVFWVGVFSSEICGYKMCDAIAVARRPAALELNPALSRA